MSHLSINVLITRLILMQKIKTLLALGALLGSAAAYAGPQSSCNSSTVEGTYAYQGSGWITTVGSPTTRTPINFVGVRQFNANGTFTTPYSLAVIDGGTAVPSTTGGTYSVSDTTPSSKGTCVVNDTQGLYTHAGVTSDNGNHISFISTASGNTISWEYVRVSR